MLATVLDRAARASRSLRDDRRLARIVGELAARGLADEDWGVVGVHRPRWSPVGVTVGRIGPGGESRLVVKVAHTDAGRAALRREHETLRALRADPRVASLLGTIPEPLALAGPEWDQVSVQRAVPGTETGDAAAAPSALAWAHELHRATAEARVVDEARLAAWVDRPLATLGGQLDAPVGQARGRWREALVGRTLAGSWIHGDLWLGNVLVRDGSISGVVDWDRAAPDELASHDVLHLLLAPERLRDPDSGRVVAAAASGRRSWSTSEMALIESVRAGLGADSPAIETLVALYWLRHAAETLRGDPGLARDRRFVATTVRPLLELDPRA